MLSGWASDVSDTMRDKALAGDAQAGIAFALLTLADELSEYRQDMGFGRRIGQTDIPGIGERIGMELSRIADAME